MIRILLVAGVAAMLMPAEAEARRGGARSATPAPAPKSSTVVVPAIGIGAAKASAAAASPARVPFPPSSAPTITRASATTAPAASQGPWCGSTTVGGFCVLN